MERSIKCLKERIYFVQEKFEKINIIFKQFFEIGFEIFQIFYQPTQQQHLQTALNRAASVRGRRVQFQIAHLRF